MGGGGGGGGRGFRVASHLQLLPHLLMLRAHLCAHCAAAAEACTDACTHAGMGTVDGGVAGLDGCLEA